MIFLGADPGTTGAIALIDEDAKVLAVEDVPTVPIAGDADSDGKIKNRIHGAQLYCLLRDLIPAGESCHALLEDVQPFNGNPAMTGAMMGAKMAIWAILDCIPEIETHKATPATWKRHFKLVKPKVGPGMSSHKALKQTKMDSRSRCIALYPDTIIGSNDNRAEALLMAVYCRVKYGAADLFVDEAQPPVRRRGGSNGIHGSKEWKPFG